MAALAAYRNLLRAARLAFQGDGFVLSAARTQIRDGFRERASLSAQDSAVQEHIRHAEDVAKILRENVVQGRPTGEDNTYKLRIHEHTERGDNDSVNTPKSSATKGGCGCS